MHSINLYCDDTYAEFERLVWLLIAHGGYLRAAWIANRGVCTVCDVPMERVDVVIDSWLGV